MKTKVIPFLRSVLGKNQIESGCENYFQHRDRHLSSYFNLEYVQFEKMKETIPDGVPVAFCNDVAGLILHVCDTRKVNLEEAMIKIGIDGGGASGIQAHGSSYPCIWCEAPKIDFSDENKSHIYALRSFGSIR
jgi:hypothetical protein